MGSGDVPLAHTPLGMSELNNITDWLRKFARLVRERDIEHGKALFANEVVGFGTVASAVSGIEDLIDQQWQQVWPYTEGFEFDYDKLNTTTADGLAWAAAPWSSVGFDDDGKPFDRHGRATIVLKQVDGAWLAIHTHFSLTPQLQPEPAP